MNTSPPGFPPVVVDRVARFLAAGCTGTIELAVWQGRIQSFKITESHRLDERERANGAAPRLDDKRCSAQDSDS